MGGTERLSRRETALGRADGARQPRRFAVNDNQRVASLRRFGNQSNGSTSSSAIITVKVRP
jgi:hypothetical protein